MTQEVVVITPEATRGSGGLADYAWRIAEEWGHRCRTNFIVPQSANVLRSALPERGGKVLVHYSAYGFDPWGYPRWLLHELVRWKRSSGGVLALMLHEIWTFWPVLNKNYLVQQLHRRDLGKLIAAADAVFTSTSSQRVHLRELGTAREVTVLPVGSNIAVRADLEQERVPGLAILFGLERTRIRTLESMQADLHALATNQKILRIVTCGAGGNPDDISREQALLASLGLAGAFEQRGALPEAEVSKLLAQASFGISGQDELSLTKSGTFMAYAAHGLNVVSPAADATKAAPLCDLVSPHELLHGLLQEELQTRAARLREWQNRTAAWPHIAEQLARGLRLSFSRDS